VVQETQHEKPVKQLHIRGVCHSEHEATREATATTADQQMLSAAQEAVLNNGAHIHIPNLRRNAT
jgi:hypothetical protein